MGCPIRNPMAKLFHLGQYKTFDASKIGFSELDRPLHYVVKVKWVRKPEYDS